MFSPFREGNLRRLATSRGRDVHLASDKGEMTKWSSSARITDTDSSDSSFYIRTAETCSRESFPVSVGQPASYSGDMVSATSLSAHGPSPPWPYQGNGKLQEASATDEVRSVATGVVSASSNGDYPPYTEDDENFGEDASISIGVGEQYDSTTISTSEGAQCEASGSGQTDSSLDDSQGPGQFLPLRGERKDKGTEVLLSVAATTVVVIGISVYIMYTIAPGPGLLSQSTFEPALYAAATDALHARNQSSRRPETTTKRNLTNHGRKKSAEDSKLQRGGSPSAIAVDDLYRHVTAEHARRRKKIAVWEGKRIYAHDFIDTKVDGTNATTAITSEENEEILIEEEDQPAPTKGAGRKLKTTPTAQISKVPRLIAETTVKRSQTKPGLKDVKFCETKVCERESVYLASYLTRSVQPCTDFYSFVCDRWRNLHPEIGTSIDTLLVQRVEDDIYHALSSKEVATSEMVKTGELLNVCVHRLSPEDYRSTLLDFMGSFGLRGWPFLRDTKTLLDVWKAAGLLLRNLGLATLVSVSVEVDPDDENRHIIALGEPSLLIGLYGTKEYHLPEWYSMAIATSFKTFTSGKYAVIVRKVRDFSYRLAEISVNRGYESFAASQYRVLQLKHHNNLAQLLTHVFKNITVIHGRIKVLVKSERYLKSLKSVTHVSKGVDMLNYMGFRALLHISPLLPDQAADIASVQMRELTGVTKHTWSRWRRCMRMFEGVIPAAFLHAYAQTKLHVVNSDKMWAVLNEIQASFVIMISNAPWMSIDDKVLLKRKLAKLKLEVFHKFWRRPISQSETLFPPFVQHRDIIMTYKSLAGQLKERKLAKICVSRTFQLAEWKGSVFDTEPLFDRDSNAIFIPMAMFDPYYMIDDESMLLQVPRVATKVVRALFQGIHQSRYPGNKLRWSVDTEMGFNDLKRCLQKHYERSGDEKIRNRITLEIDVLDSMSLLPAFKLFVKQVNQVNIEHYGLLTGQNITVKQLFFILYAKSLCETTDTKEKKRIMQESVRSVSSLRVNAPLRNSFRFPAFWDCASGSPMNPHQKCTIWTS